MKTVMHGQPFPIHPYLRWVINLLMPAIAIVQSSADIEPIDLQPLWILASDASQELADPRFDIAPTLTMASMRQTWQCIPGMALLDRGGSAVEPMLRGMTSERIATSFFGLRLPPASPTRTHAPAQLMLSSAATIHVISAQPSLTLGAPASGGRIEADAAADTLNAVPTATTMALHLQPERSGWSAGIHHQRAALLQQPAVHLSLQQQSLGNLRTPEGAIIPSQQNHFSGSLLLGTRPVHGWTHQLAVLHHQQGRNDHVSLPLDTIRAHFTAVAWVHEFQPDSSAAQNLRIRYGASKHDILLDNRFRTMPPLPVSNMAHTRSQHMDVRWRHRAGSHGTLIHGLDFNRETRDSIRQRGELARDSIWPEIVTWQAGVVTEYQFNPAPTSTFRAGIRLDQHHSRAKRMHAPAFSYPITSLYQHFAEHPQVPASRSQQELVPSANLLLQWITDSGQALYVGWTTTAQVPGATERYRALLQALGGGFEIGNPELKPERKWEMVAGWSVTHPMLHLRIEMFANEITDYHWRKAVGTTTGLESLPQGQMVYSYRNVPVRHIGAELSGVLQSPDGQWKLPFQLHGVHAQLQSTGTGYQRGDRLPELPPLNARIALQHQQAWGDAYQLQWECSWHWYESQCNPLPHLLPIYRDSSSHQQVDLSLQITAISAWSLSFSLHNLFNSTQFPYLQLPASDPPGSGSLFQEGERIPLPGRNLQFMLEYRF